MSPSAVNHSREQVDGRKDVGEGRGWCLSHVGWGGWGGWWCRCLHAEEGWARLRVCRQVPVGTGDTSPCLPESCLMKSGVAACCMPLRYEPLSGTVTTCSWNAVFLLLLTVCGSGTWEKLSLLLHERFQLGRFCFHTAASFLQCTRKK